MRSTVFVVGLLALSSPAFGQALGSVHCKASLRQIEVDLNATQLRLDAVELADSAKKCSAQRVRAVMLERADQIYGRCLEGTERETKTRDAQSGAAALREKIAEGCNN